MAEIVPASDPRVVDLAAHALRAGELVAYPTDTVYGLGAAVSNEAAVRKMFTVKNRPPSKAVPLLVADTMMASWVADITPLAQVLIGAFWPGGLTIVMRKVDTFHSLALGKEKTVALRVPDHSLVRSIIFGVGEPITGTSANRAGARPPVTAAEAALGLGELVAFVIDGGPVRHRVESTVVDLTQDTAPVVLLREGAVSREELQRVLGEADRVTELKTFVAAIATLLVLLAVACGGDGGENDYTADEIVQKVQAAVIQPGMVFHATGDDGSEVWLDPETQRFRRKDAATRGGLTSIGEGWTRYSYDPFDNVVSTEDLSPGATPPRIANPMAPWFEPITALAYGVELTVIGRTTADGREVIAVESRSPVLDSSGQFSGNFLQGRVEVDAATFIPTAFEQREIVATGGAAMQPTPAQARIRYTAELVALTSLPADFFDRSVVENAVLTVEENLQKVRDLALTPYWLGEQFVGPGGPLKLPENNNFIVDDTNGIAEIHYSYIAAVTQTSGEPLPDTVIIRLAASSEVFVPPDIPSFAGDIPEQRQVVTARGGQAVVLGSLLSPADLPCETGDCPPTSAPLYHRIIFQIGDTAVQIEAMARVDATGADRDHYNSVDGVIALAEALVEAISAAP